MTKTLTSPHSTAVDSGRGKFQVPMGIYILPQKYSLVLDRLFHISFLSWKRGMREVWPAKLT